jgi:hypothetical protein
VTANPFHPGGSAAGRWETRNETPEDVIASVAKQSLAG